MLKNSKRGTQMKKLLGGSCGILLALTMSQTVWADDHDHGHGGGGLNARLSGNQEVPVVSTPAKGTFALMMVDANTLNYSLTMSGLKGTVTQAHIHIAQPNVAGGIMIWLCGTATNPGPAGTPVCPAAGGTVTGTIIAANVVGPAGQGIAVGAFADALAAIEKGLAYANIHSTLAPGGEIRGQIRGDD